jgi:NAD-dependent dihydropyrimidine dehydrogenase PreA subunit
MTIERIDPDLCIGCGLCHDVYYADVIRMDEETQKAVVKFAQDCVLCCWCLHCAPGTQYIFRRPKPLRFLQAGDKMRNGSTFVY